MKKLLVSLAVLFYSNILLAAPMSSYPTKTTPVSNDKFIISDSEASNATKQITLGNVAFALGGFRIQLGELADLQILDTGSTYTNLVDDTVIYGGTYDTKHVWSIDKVGSELAGKQATLSSGTNIKTINSQSLLGSGNITITGTGGTDVGSVTLDCGDATTATSTSVIDGGASI